MNQEVRSPGSGGAGWMSKDDRPQPSQNLNTKKQLTDISLLTWKVLTTHNCGDVRFRINCLQPSSLACKTCSICNSSGEALILIFSLHVDRDLLFHNRRWNRAWVQLSGSDALAPTMVRRKYKHGPPAFQATCITEWKMNDAPEPPGEAVFIIIKEMSRVV